jgi:hypothetical protein
MSYSDIPDGLMEPRSRYGTRHSPGRPTSRKSSRVTITNSNTMLMAMSSYRHSSIEDQKRSRTRPKYATRVSP